MTAWPGVLSGLEIVRTLNDLQYETDHPIVVVNWTNEEGTRFSPAMLSSGVWAGAFTKDYAYGRTDRDGKRLGDELLRIGYKGDLPCRPQDWKCHLELHIEQGPILEAEGKEIGVVTGGQGIRWYDVKITGKESHAGSTPMPRRKDALVAASRIIVALDEIARAHAPHAVTTVGELEIARPSRNVIPGEVLFSVDMRHPEEASDRGDGQGAARRGGGSLCQGLPAARGRADLELSARALRRGLHHGRARCGTGSRLRPSRHGLRPRPRFLLHGPLRADLDGLHPLQGRAVPQ